MRLPDQPASGGPLVRAGQPWGDATLARLYDAFPFDADVPLYLELASAQGGRVLEVACGTGRVLVPLAPAWLLEPPGSLRQDLVQEDRDQGITVARTEAVVSTDLASQVRVIRSAYEIVAADGSVTKRFVEWPYRYIYRFEAELLLEQAGF